MLMRWAAGIILILGLGGAPSRGAALAAPCVGDCDGSGSVAVNELITGVNMALGVVAGSACAAFLPAAGQTVPEVSDLIAGVNHALTGCPVTATTAGIVFNAEANRLHAYRAAPGFPRQTVIPSDADAPGLGRDINAQICFTRGPRGELRFIAGEDTGQGTSHLTAGWGLFELDGEFPNFTWRQLNEFIPTYQAGDEAENYGCGFLSDGRLVTTDVGNQATGEGTGQLIIWFPPLDGSGGARYCKLDVGIATAQQIAIDAQDRVYVAAARTTGASPAGVYRYSGSFPTADDAEGGCGRLDPTNAPLVSDGRITKERIIPAGRGGLTNPSGVVLTPGGGYYVASVFNGVISEFDAQGEFVRRILNPVGAPDFPLLTGHPLGLGLASDGTLYFADVGLRRSGGDIGPGRNLGSVRRIRFVNSEPQLPEIMDEGLNFPDGIGILEVPLPAATPVPMDDRMRRPTASRRPS